MSVLRRQRRWGTRDCGSYRRRRFCRRSAGRASGYRINFDYQQGYTDVSNWPVTFGYGLKDKRGALRLVDARPPHRPRRAADLPAGQLRVVGGLVNEYPFVSGGWSGNQLGDLWLGGKFNLMSEWQQKPMALAVRGIVKLPTAKDDEEGVGTGKADFLFDFIASKEINQRVELSGYGGFIFRGDPDNVDISDGFRWGIGAGFPTRKSLRLTAELHGESQFDDVVYNGAVARLIGEDGSLPPLVSDTDSQTHFTLGLTWQAKNGFFAGAGANWRFGMEGRELRRFGIRRRGGRRIRLPGPHRLPPWRADLRAAAAANAAAGAGAGAQARSRAGREGVVRAVHG